MPNATLSDTRLLEHLDALDAQLLSVDARRAAFETFLSTPSGRQRPSRFWRTDLDALTPPAELVSIQVAKVRIEHAPGRVVACDLQTAARQHGQLLRRAFGATPAANTKFGALARAFAGLGAFVSVPADYDAADPITITYGIHDNATAFPYTVILLERGARATVIERFEGGANAFVCGAIEAVTGENAQLTVASKQQLEAGARFVYTRAARPGRDSAASFACADLGSDLCVGEVTVEIEQPGIEAGITSLFFPSGSQLVDIVNTVDHAVGDSNSETVVKSAAVGTGQARYLGNIRIAKDAQGSDASLRDDALLLSKRAHIDSVPALEIGANDVKAYHGATVGALDEEQLFYLQTRGIDRNAAERTIALGFFEPAIGRFPTEALRERIRTAVAEKLA